MFTPEQLNELLAKVDEDTVLYRVDTLIDGKWENYTIDVILEEALIMALDLREESQSVKIEPIGKAYRKSAA